MFPEPVITLVGGGGGGKATTYNSKERGVKGRLEMNEDFEFPGREERKPRWEKGSNRNQPTNHQEGEQHTAQCFSISTMSKTASHHGVAVG